MTTDDHVQTPDTSAPVPVFTIPQARGLRAEIDFTTPGPYSDFALTARITRPDGTLRERAYVAYHSEEAAIFVEILQHWARVATPQEARDGLDRAQTVLQMLTAGMEPTTESQNSFDYVLAYGIAPLAALDVIPTENHHRDERGRIITLAPLGRDLRWISRRGPRTAFTVPPDHLWMLVAGMVWRSYRSDTGGGVPLTRLNTREYERALSAFRRAIQKRAEA